MRGEYKTTFRINDDDDSIIMPTSIRKYRGDITTRRGKTNIVYMARLRTRGTRPKNKTFKTYDEAFTWIFAWNRG